MIVTLDPVGSDRTTTVEVDDLTLIVDGESYDFSEIPEGGDALGPEGGPFIGRITRDAVKIRYHYNLDLAENAQNPDPRAWIFDLQHGSLPDPIKWRQTDVGI